MDEFEPSPAVAKIRDRLGHPVIDSDGHLVEVRQVPMDYIARAGGTGVAARFAEEQRSTFLSRDWYGLSDAERMARWTVLQEVFEPVADGLIDEADLRDFVFANPVRLWTSTNPRCFDGTVVESAASDLLAADTLP